MNELLDCTSLPQHQMPSCSSWVKWPMDLVNAPCMNMTSTTTSLAHTKRQSLFRLPRRRWPQTNGEHKGACKMELPTYFSDFLAQVRPTKNQRNELKTGHTTL